MNNIIPNGSEVVFKGGKQEAIVIGVCVRGEANQSIEYEVTYFFNGDRKTVWIHSFEIDIKIDNSKPMGFSMPKEKPLIGKY
jgi:hypothetical protein